ncbi:MAG: hypothetical protein H6809_02575 [Phycisphaeraceae bacterium]|nr:hypothetical protein [Phycisphaeraceae bacterium]
MALALAWCAGVAWAQSAHIVVTHDDPDGLVDPGQVVRINFRISWTANHTLSTLLGDAVARPDAGVASNPGTELNMGQPSGSLALGTPALGSVRGFSLIWGPSPFQMPGTTYWDGLDFLWYEWEAPAVPGPFEFDFVFDPQTQGAWLNAGLTNVFKVDLTSDPASLVVVPSPGALVVLGVGAVFVRRRRAISA